MSSQPFFIPAVIILLFAIPLILGLIPRDRAYGIRTGNTLSDDRTWCAVNRFGGWALLGASVLYLGVAMIFPCSASAGTALLPWSLHLAAFVGPLLLSVVFIRRYVKNP
ncbi:MAG TPA: SdpI family protein [Methylomirabilota bacterium]|jgi:hypothetical protein|nr:SdpI family protein [Methylomirabilota bacterium]